MEKPGSSQPARKHINRTHGVVFVTKRKIVLKARNTSMTATVSVARVAPSQETVDRDFHPNP
jgi:hypothetical protein